MTNPHDSTLPGAAPGRDDCPFDHDTVGPVHICRVVAADEFRASCSACGWTVGTRCTGHPYAMVTAAARRHVAAQHDRRRGRERRDAR